jgi:hypothetical protein
MKPTLRDYIITLAALLVVFACGYGIGHQVGSRPLRAAIHPPEIPGVTWEDSVFRRIDGELALTEEQRPEVRRELTATVERIEATKQLSRDSVRQELVEFHRRVAPLLNPNQRDRLKKSERALQLPMH